MERPYNPLQNCQLTRQQMNDYLLAKQQNKKYILYKKVGDLWQIMACRTIWQELGNNYSALVLEGELGGFVESEDNLSHDGKCWIYDSAKTVGHARVSGNALVKHASVVEQYAEVFGNAVLNDFTTVSGNARVCDKAVTFGNVFVVNDAVVCDEARLNGNIYVCDNACVCGRVQVYTYQDDSKIIEGDMLVC